MAICGYPIVNGSPCHNFPRQGKKYCWMHDGTPKKNELLQEEIKVAEERRALASFNLSKTEEVVRDKINTINELHKKNIKLESIIKEYEFQISEYKRNMNDVCPNCGLRWRWSKQALKGETDGNSRT